MLVLLFLRQVLIDLAGKSGTSGDAVLTSVLMTPLGTFGGILESQLELLQMPYVSETGGAGRIPMKKLYLDHILDELAANLGLNVDNLLDGSREFVIAADIDLDKDEECCPCYYATTTDSDGKESLQHLESTVMACLDNNLDTLPASVVNGWRKGILQTLLSDIKTKIERAHRE